MFQLSSIHIFALSPSPWDQSSLVPHPSSSSSARPRCFASSCNTGASALLCKQRTALLWRLRKQRLLRSKGRLPLHSHRDSGSAEAPVLINFTHVLPIHFYIFLYLSIFIHTYILYFVFLSSIYYISFVYIYIIILQISSIYIFALSSSRWDRSSLVSHPYFFSSARPRCLLLHATLALARCSASDERRAALTVAETKTVAEQRTLCVYLYNYCFCNYLVFISSLLVHHPGINRRWFLIRLSLVPQDPVVCFFMQHWR